MEPEVIKRVHCNQCETLTNHCRLYHRTFLGLFSDNRHENSVDEPAHPDEADWQEDFEILRCCGCDTVCVRHQYSQNDVPDDIGTTVRFYPPRLFRRIPAWKDRLPFELSSLLAEVYAALAANSLRLAVMGSRAVVDMVILDKVGDVGPFRQKLQELESQGYIGRVGREHLQAAFDLGSAAAHRGHVPDVDEVAIVIDIVENLLQAVYVLGVGADNLRANTPPRFPRGSG
jgi:hypothetical protein